MSLAGLLGAAALQSMSLDTGLDVLRTCQNSEQRLLCYGYIRGLTDGLGTMGMRYGMDGNYCLPANMNLEETRRVLVQDLEARRDLWATNGIAAVVIVLRTAFPCA